MHATLTICATAIILSIAGWTHPGLEAFVLEPRAFADQPWRVLSSQFVHANLVHLYLNLNGIWFLGRAIEERLGQALLLGTTLFMLLGTSIAVWAFDRSAIGLSGVIYGMWAMIFVGERSCPLLRGILTKKINQMMVLWFFFCVLATWQGWLPISNWAHGAGAALGALVGLGFRADGSLKRMGYPLGAAVLALLACGASIWWPKWNFGGAAVEFEREADVALDREDWPAAEHALASQVHFDALDKRAWWNLGVVQGKRGAEGEAIESFYHSFQCGSMDAEQKEALRAGLLMQMNVRVLHGDERAALEFGKRAVEVSPVDREAWTQVENLAQALGDKEWSERARSALAKLDLKR